MATFLGNDVGITVTVRYLGKLATVNCPSGRLVYNGSEYVDPTKAKFVMLAPNSGSLPQAAALSKVPLSYGGADSKYLGGAQASNLMLCEVVGLADSSNNANELITTPPVVGMWLMTVPISGVELVTPTVN